MAEKVKSPIVGRVCKHVHQGFSKAERFDDLTAIKITNVHADGSRSEDYSLIKNFQQPFWIVKPEHRKFKQQKDYIEAKKCKQFKSNTAKLAYMITKVLHGSPDPKANLRQVLTNPYVFGCDQSAPVFIKQRFFDKYEEYQQTERYSVAAYDVETDMEKKGEPVMMASVTMRDKVYFATVRSWWNGLTDEEILTGLAEEEEKRFKEEKMARKITVFEYGIFDTPGQVIENCIKRFHEWSPDLVASWNATYDMEKNEQGLNADGRPLERIYCDPSIPDEFTHYRLDRGRTHKIKENGDKTPLEPQEKFPTIRSMAKWQWLDFMSFYAIKRAPGGKLDSYGLNECAKREGVDGKLYTDEGSHLIEGKADWHRYMQKNHKFIYAMYNIKDNWVIEDLNDKTLDLSMSFPLLTKASEYFNYPSQPRIISDALAYIARDNGYVWGCAGGGKNEFNDMLPTLGDWIALLETEKNASKGYILFDGLYDVYSNGRSAVSDVDVAGAYPYATVTENVSNYTTQIEVCRIQGKDPLKQREIAVNYASSPEANAVMLCEELFNFPSYDTVVEKFEEILVKQELMPKFMKSLEEEDMEIGE
jgi:hypothetical protein